jgi:tetratricopeptide (TPR) repeat protein
MKIKASLSISLLLGALVFTTSIYAQKGIDDGSQYGHGEDSIRCLRNMSLYREYVRQNLYKDALPFWRVTFRECPRASLNIYIDGVKIYKYFIEKEENSDIQSALIDTLMMIYDQRIVYYKDVCNVRGRQGVDLLRYRRTEDIDYIVQGYNYLLESMELCKNRTSEAVLATLLSASLTLCQNDRISSEQVLKDFLNEVDILNNRIIKEPDNSDLVMLEESLINNFSSKPVCDCDRLISAFSERIEKNPHKVDDLKVITAVLKQSGCTDSELFFKASKHLYDSLPSAESAENIAVLAFIKDKYHEAIKYYNQAVKLENDSLRKANYYLGLAKSNYKLRNFQNAKNLALKAISLRKGWGEPYMLIGQIYAESKDEFSSECIPKAVYWAAVDKFIEAKRIDPGVEKEANNLISTYSVYFPSKEDAFFCGVHEGDTYRIGSWINEATIARF